MSALLLSDLEQVLLCIEFAFVRFFVLKPPFCSPFFCVPDFKTRKNYAGSDQTLLTPHNEQGKGATSVLDTIKLPHQKKEKKQSGSAGLQTWLATGS